MMTSHDVVPDDNDDDNDLDEEEIDPRVEDELERLNACTDEINQVHSRFMSRLIQTSYEELSSSIRLFPFPIFPIDLRKKTKFGFEQTSANNLESGPRFAKVWLSGVFHFQDFRFL